MYLYNETQTIVNDDTIDNEIKALQALKRKQRADKGKTRNKYAANLSPKIKTYISRANSKGLEFSLTQEEFDNMLAKNCTYCDTPNAGTIDRIDSRKGYITTNSTPCCFVCNTMKMGLSLDEFKAHIKRISDNFII